jgi:hypothetical protein
MSITDVTVSFGMTGIKICGMADAGLSVSRDTYFEAAA